MSTEAYDMTEHWRLITAEASNDAYRVSGTWWLAIESKDITAVDVTIWDKQAQYGLVYGRELTSHAGKVAYRGGRESHQAMAEDAKDLIAEVCEAILAVEIIPILGGER